MARKRYLVVLMLDKEQAEVRQWVEAESMDQAVEKAEAMLPGASVEMIEEYPLSPTWEQRHFNAIAKEIRELFPTFDPSDVMHGGRGNLHKEQNMARRGVLSALALSLAHRFKADNPKFDVMKFLSACSPDNDRFPITELWEEE